MKYLTFLLTLAVTLFSYKVNAGVPELSNCVCRVSNGVTMGTGFAYKKDEKNYYLITAGHFQGSMDNIVIDVYHSGAAWAVQGKTLFHVYKENTTDDLTVISTDRHVLDSKYKPFDLVKFGLNYKEKPLTIIWNYGCPDGHWPSAFKGRLLPQEQEWKGFIPFGPAVIGGRSGSPLMNYDCTTVIGMVVMCDGVRGLATPIDTINKILVREGLEP
jgi:hypothetical protein